MLEYKYETLAARLRELSYLNKGIRLTLTDKRNKEESGEFGLGSMSGWAVFSNNNTYGVSQNFGEQ